jgi:tetratricopeptide (TPR) repeat protein
MAACHRALKQHKEALILYGQILNGHEGLAPWAQLQIGYTYEEMTARELAIKAFQSCCKKFPKASYASTAHAHLQNKYKISVTLGGATDE